MPVPKRERVFLLHKNGMDLTKRTKNANIREQEYIERAEPRQRGLTKMNKKPAMRQTDRQTGRIRHFLCLFIV